MNTLYGDMIVLFCRFTIHKERERIWAVDREKRNNHWLKKTASSPFAVDLAAESERITEENRIRQLEETKRRGKGER